MTKKFIHITIALLVVILTIGFTLSKHYCGGMLIEVSLFSSNPAGCQENGIACSMDGCCRDVHQVIQLDETYTHPAVLDTVPFFPVTLASIDLPVLDQSFFQFLRPDNLPPDKSPPPPGVLRLLSGLQIFRL